MPRLVRDAILVSALSWACPRIRRPIDLVRCSAAEAGMRTTRVARGDPSARPDAEFRTGLGRIQRHVFAVHRSPGALAEDVIRPAAKPVPSRSSPRHPAARRFSQLMNWLPRSMSKISGLPSCAQDRASRRWARSRAGGSKTSSGSLLLKAPSISCDPRQPSRSDAKLPGDAGKTTVLDPFKKTRWKICAWIARDRTCASTSRPIET